MSKLELKPMPEGKIRPRIDKEFCEGVAKAIARGLTQTEAVLLIGEGKIKPEAFEVWKCKNRERYDKLYTRIKGARINRLLDRIELHANGSKPDGIRSDWRASHALLAMTDARFAANKPEPTAEQKTPLLAIISSDLAASVFGKLLPAPDAPKAIVDAQVIAPPSNNGEANG